MSADLVAHLVAIVVSLAVGAPLLRRGLRSSDTPVVLLGTCLVVEGLEWFFWMIAAFTPVSDTPAVEVLAVACRLGISVATICMLLFTLIVFRRKSRVAQAFVFVLVAGMLVGFIASGTVGDWGGWRGDHPGVWVELVSQAIAYAWATLEPLAYYAMMRRRVASGLTPPLIANRFLLWGVYAGMFFLTQLGYIVTNSFHDSSSALDLIMISLTILGEIALWFAFFPPARYAVWIESRHAVADLPLTSSEGAAP